MERGAVGLGACFAAIDTIVTIYFWGYDTRQMTAIYMPTLGNGKSKGSVGSENAVRKVTINEIFRLMKDCIEKYSLNCRS